MPKSLSLSLALTKKVMLFPEDEKDDSFATFRQATQAAVEKIAEINSVAERTAGEDTIRTFFNAADVVAIQVYETMIECNLVLSEGGDLIFPSTKDGNGHTRLALTETEFRQRWKQLPPDWCDRIHNGVLEANPIWDPEVQKKLKKNSDESEKKQ